MHHLPGYVISATVALVYINVQPEYELVEIDPTSRLINIEQSGFSPKTLGNHISWDATLMASLVKIGGRLRPVKR